MTDVGRSTDRWLASENIKHYEKKIQETKDESRRRILRGLIEEERDKLGKPDEPEARHA
jgi:hypothetical protein